MNINIFERAIELDPNALEGSALTSLGSLYYQVPGWPIGFGDDKKAAEYLKKGLSINPDGIDPNYFYADYLFRSGDYSGAEKSLRKALQAPARNGRKVADDGRRKEINQLLEKVAEKRPMKIKRKPISNLDFKLLKPCIIKRGKIKMNK